MANKRISELPLTGTTNAQDFIHLSQGGVDKRLPVEKFLEQVSGGNPFNFTVIEESSDFRMLGLSDVRGYIRTLSDLDTTILVPNTSFSPWRLGHNIIIRKEGLGKVSILEGAGVTLGASPYGYTLLEPGQIGQLIYVGNNRWDFLTGIDTGGGGAPVDQSQLDAEIAARKAADKAEEDARVAGDQNLQSQLTGTAPLAASAFSEISWHNQTVSNSVSIPAGKNAWSFGPTMTVATGQTVTIGAGSFWTIANGEVQ